MYRKSLVGLLSMFVLTTGLFLVAQDTKPKPVYRGFLYRNWKKLGLTDAQKQQVYKVQGEFEAKIRALRQQIQQLERQERLAAIKVLTKAQYEQLKEVGSLSFRRLLKELEDEKKTPPKPEK